MIETQHPTEPNSSVHRATRWNRGPFASDQPITQALMIPLGVVVRHELSDGAPQRRLADEDHAIETLVFDRAYEPLGVGVQVRRPRRQSDDLHPLLFNEPAPVARVLHVPIDEELLAVGQQPTIDVPCSPLARTPG
jgi:hypothetical protein